MNYALGLVMTDFDAAPPLGALAGPATRASIEAIYDSHQGELFGVTLRACRDREIAEEIVQEAFLRLIVEVEAGRAPDNVRAWLHRVAANLVVSGGRRASVAHRWRFAVARGDATDKSEQSFLDFERRSDLAALLADLSTEARTALLLAAHGFRGNEIASAIGRSENATRTLMCRARLQLRERLAAAEVPA